jgi:spoIIIJ-associated protein
MAIIEEEKQAIVELLQTVLNTMGIEARISPEDNLNGTEFNIYTPDSRLLIGQRGANLAALQTLIHSVTYRRFPGIERFSIDIDDYRKQREYRLREIAKHAAAQVKKNNKPVKLEAMNPYERRIVHAYLSNEYGIDTTSVGKEPNRKIIISPKAKGEI